MNFCREEAVPVHLNTLKIILKNEEDITGMSIGGGSVQITELSGFPLKLSGDNPTILILHKDAYGAIAAVSNVLAKHKINISSMEVSRIEKGQSAMMVIETDQGIPEKAIEEIKDRDNIIKVVVLDK